MTSPSISRMKSSTSSMDWRMSCNRSARSVAGSLGQGRLGHVLDQAPLLQHGHQQVTLGREVVVQRGDVETGGGGQRPHARPVDPLLAHERQGGAEDVLTLGRPVGSAGLFTVGGHLPIVAPQVVGGAQGRVPGPEGHSVVPNERLS